MVRNLALQRYPHLAALATKYRTLSVGKPSAPKPAQAKAKKAKVAPPPSRAQPGRFAHLSGAVMPIPMPARLTTTPSEAPAHRSAGDVPAGTDAVQMARKALPELFGKGRR